MLQVIATCTQRKGLLPMLEKQLDTAGIAFHVEPLAHMPNGVGNLDWKVKYVRRMLDKFGDVEHLVFTDAWDVLFYGTERDVVSKITGDVPILAAERNCWPDAYLAPHFPGDTPWKYPNGGLMAGTPETIDNWLRMIVTDPSYCKWLVDQQFLNHRRLQGHVMTSGLDTHTELFYCCFQDQGELQFENGMPVNALCGTRPSFLHMNGNTELAPFMMRRMVSLPIHDKEEVCL